MSSIVKTTILGFLLVSCVQEKGAKNKASNDQSGEALESSILGVQSAFASGQENVSKTITEGSDFKHTFYLVQNSKIKFQWSFQEIKSSTKVKLRDQVGTTLKLNRTSTSQSGTYILSVALDGQNFNDNRKIFLTVEKKSSANATTTTTIGQNFSFLEPYEIKNFEVNKGSKFSYTVPVTDSSSAKYFWYFESSTSKKLLSGQIRNRLELSNVQTNQSGNYILSVAPTGDKQTTNRKIHLKVVEEASNSQSGGTDQENSNSSNKQVRMNWDPGYYVRGNHIEYGGTKIYGLNWVENVITKFGNPQNLRGIILTASPKKMTEIGNSNSQSDIRLRQDPNDVHGYLGIVKILKKVKEHKKHLILKIMERRAAYIPSWFYSKGLVSKTKFGEDTIQLWKKEAMDKYIEIIQKMVDTIKKEDPTLLDTLYGISTDEGYLYMNSGVDGYSVQGQAAQFYRLGVALRKMLPKVPTFIGMNPAMWNLKYPGSSNITYGDKFIESCIGIIWADSTERATQKNSLLLTDAIEPATGKIPTLAFGDITYLYEEHFSNGDNKLVDIYTELSTRYRPTHAGINMQYEKTWGENPFKVFKNFDEYSEDVNQILANPKFFLEKIPPSCVADLQ